jgi:hypothetical protein
LEVGKKRNNEENEQRREGSREGRRRRGRGTRVRRREGGTRKKEGGRGREEEGRRKEGVKHTVDDHKPKTAGSTSCPMISAEFNAAYDFGVTPWIEITPTIAQISWFLPPPTAVSSLSTRGAPFRIDLDFEIELVAEIGAKRDNSSF